MVSKIDPSYDVADGYKFSKVVVRGFRGIDSLDLDLRDGIPSVLVGSNNAGKSTVLHAIALALNGGGYHQWSPSESDFFCGNAGQRASDFIVQVNFHSGQQLGYPAVKGVGQPTLIHLIRGARTRAAFSIRPVASALRGLTRSGFGTS